MIQCLFQAVLLHFSCIIYQQLYITIYQSTGSARCPKSSTYHQKKQVLGPKLPSVRLEEGLEL